MPVPVQTDGVEAGCNPAGGRMDEVTVGIDIETTSVKAVAADAGGKVLARVRIPHRVVSPDLP